jgi:hypothetical protein
MPTWEFMKNECKLPNFLEKYFFLWEMNYEHIIVYLRLIKTHGQDTNNMKNEFKVQALPQWSYTTPRSPLLSLGSLSHSRNKVGRMHGGVEKSERHGIGLNRWGFEWDKAEWGG